MNKFQTENEENLEVNENITEKYKQNGNQSAPVLSSNFLKLNNMKAKKLSLLAIKSQQIKYTELKNEKTNEPFLSYFSFLSEKVLEDLYRNLIWENKHNPQSVNNIDKIKIYFKNITNNIN